MKGLDLSKHNGIIDWAQVKASGIEFAINRIGYGNSASQIDIQFEANYAGAKANGIKQGGYWFSYATSVADAIKEAQACLAIINNRGFELPIFYDYEYDSAAYSVKQGVEPTIELVQAMTHAFNSTIINAGYTAGIYTNPDCINRYFKDVVHSYPLWLAKWGANDGTGDYSAKPSGYDTLVCWQYTSKGTCPGVNDSDIDLDFGYFGAMVSTPEPTPVVDAMSYKYKIGDHLVFNTCHKSSTEPLDQYTLASDMLRNHGVITRTIAGTLNPHLLDGGLCWVNDGDILGYYEEYLVPAYREYTVQYGDTLSEIAERFQTTYQKIAADNGISNPNNIRANQVLKIY